MACLKDQRGFTFIELMITMVVVVLALLGLMSANSAIQRSSEAAYSRAVAIQDANQVIERMRNAAASGTFPANVTGVYANNGVVAGFSSLTNETVTVTYVNAAADPLDVTVTTSWSENGVRTVSTSMRSYITQRT